jgi:hypothetical protein
LSWLWIAIACEWQGEVIGGVEQPGIAGLSGKEDEWADGDDARVAVGSPALDGANFIGQAESPASYDTLS